MASTSKLRRRSGPAPKLKVKPAPEIKYRKDGEPKITGRPPMEIDWEAVQRAAYMHLTPMEIACLLRVNYTTLTTRREFPVVYRVGWERGRASLRRMQWRKAVEGDTKMLIFLGKQILGQRELWSNELSPTSGEPYPEELEQAGERPDLSKLSLEELKQLQALVLKAKAKPEIEAQVITADIRED